MSTSRNIGGSCSTRSSSSGSSAIVYAKNVSATAAVVDDDDDQQYRRNRRNVDTFISAWMTALRHTVDATAPPAAGVHAGDIDYAAVGRLLATDSEGFEFRSPVMHSVFKGPGARQKTDAIVRWIVSEVLEGFRYTHVYRDYGSERVDDSDGQQADGGGCALVFRGRVCGTKLEAEGVDLIRCNTRGQCRKLTVLIRPLKALQAVQREMGKRLAVMMAQHAGAVATASSSKL